MAKATFLVAGLVGWMATSVAHAEIVKCQTNGAEDQTTVDVAWSHYPGSPEGYQSLTATLKNMDRRWGYTHTVKRKQRSGVLYYNDVLDESSFSLAIQSAEVAGAHLEAEVTLNKGLWFEKKISGLTCQITGAPNPPVVACPKEAELDAKLVQAARYGTADDVEWLLDCGAKIGSKDRLGCTALLAMSDLACGHVAGPGGHPADPNSGSSPIHSSRDSFSLEAVLKVLLTQNPNLNAKDPVTGETSLHKLVKYGHTSPSWTLIEAGARVNAQDRDGTTALMIAAASGNDIMVRTVLDGEPDLSLKNKKGETAYQIAEKAGFTYLLEMLKVAVASQTVEGKSDGTCAPKMVHIFKDKEVEIVLKAPKEDMFLLTAPDLGLELMAMPGESVRQTITPKKKGTFPYTCGVHGAEKQTQGSFMVM